MTNMKPKESIPVFKTIQEEAEFWDTHDTADYADQMVPVKMTVNRPLSRRRELRLDAQTDDQLEARAQEKGVGASTLARMWIKEMLQRGA